MKKKTCYQEPIIKVVKLSASNIFLLTSGDDNVNDSDIRDLFEAQ